MCDVEYLAALDKASTDPVLAGLLDSARAPFDRAEWWSLLGSDGGMKPLYAVARNDNGAALLALWQDGGTIRPLANWYTFRWRPLSTPGVDPLPLLEAIGTMLPRRAWRLVFDQVPDEDGSASALDMALRAAGWIVSREVHDSNHVLEVSKRSYADFLATRPGPLRTTLKRRSAKIICKIFSTFQEDVWHTYQEIYASSWKPEEGNPAFLRAFARAEGRAGRLRMGLAFIADRPVAAQFWTVDNGKAYIHKLAHREDARALSPGTVLSAALFAQAIDRDKVAQIDFGTGNDPYKRDWMDDIRPRYRIEALWPKAPQAWPRLARRLLRV